MTDIMLEGSILSMYMEDFMTYSKVMFVPRKYLNVITGPNGTGKSTLVCAMVLGFGGKPKWLGRMTNLNSYIRAGCKTAKIEIQLYSSKGNRVLTRILTSDNKSTWLLDGYSATQKQIEDVVSKFNIQVDNLCQFLPQDRVADFAKMNPQALLESTEKCVGPPGMFEQHEELKKLYDEYVNYEHQLKNLSTRLNDEEQKKNRLEVHVSSMTEKRDMLHTVESLKQKRAWLLYDNSRKKVKEAKKDKQQALANVKKYEKLYEPLAKLVESAKTRVKYAERNFANNRPDMNKKFSSVREVQEEMEGIENEIKENIIECDQKIQAEEQRRQNVKSLVQQISKLENDLTNIDQESVNGVKSEIDEIFSKLTDKSMQHNKLRETREQYQALLEDIGQEIHANQLSQRRVRDIANERLELLRRRQKDVYQAVMWLRENRNRFKYPVYEPMMLEINVRNPQFAKYVETTIPVRDLLAFTFEDKGDMHEFLRLLRDGQRLRVNAVHSGKEHPSYASYKPSMEMQYLRQYGFHTYLTEMIDAPESIMKYLCRMYRIQNIPVGDASTFHHYESIPDAINCFFSDKFTFLITKSKYTGLKSTRTSEVNSPSLLAISVDTQRLKELEERLESLEGERRAKLETVAEVQSNIHKLTSNMETLRCRRKELSEILERQKTVQTRLVARQRQLAALEKERVDPETEKIKCCRINQNLIEQYIVRTGRLVTLMKEYDHAFTLYKLSEQQLDMAREEAVVNERESHELLRKRDHARGVLQDIDAVIKRSISEATKLYDMAKETTGGTTPRDAKFSEFKKSFHFFPDTEEELDKEIQDYQAKANCLGSSNDDVMAEYETKKNQIAALKGNVESKERELERLKTRLDSLREEWLPPLQELVSQINNKYGECFARLQCVGEVSLVTGDTENDYGQYGIKIKVKFRDGDQLQELNHHLQSGGERAVSTAVYMIALQELTRVPFCCVDEINQGMDATNERLIFELLVLTTTASGTQYFLLTPKLLPSLLYNDATTVHCVHNGIGVSTDKRFGNITAFLRKRHTKPERA